MTRNHVGVNSYTPSENGSGRGVFSPNPTTKVDIRHKTNIKDIEFINKAVRTECQKFPHLSKRNTMASTKIVMLKKNMNKKQRMARTKLII